MNDGVHAALPLPSRGRRARDGVAGAPAARRRPPPQLAARRRSAADVRAPQSVLRHLSQRAAEDGRPGARRAGPRPRRRRTRRRGKRSSASSRPGMMPPSGARRPERAVLDAFAVGLEARLDRAARARRKPRRAGAAPAEPHRIRERDPRSARARRRRRDAAAGRRLERRLRQHRRRARRLAGADPGLRLGGDEDQPPRGRRSRRSAPTQITYRGARRACRRIGTSKACRSARAAACSFSTRSRSTPSTSSASRGGVRARRRRRRARRSTSRSTASSSSRRQRRAASACPSRPARTRSARRSSSARAAAGVDEQFSDFRVDSAFTAGGRHPDGRRSPARSTPPGAGDTPSRRRIFVCRPATPADEAACARQDPHDARARAPIAGRCSDEPKSTTLMRFYRAGPRRTATSKPASSRRWRASSSRRVSLPLRRRAGERRGRRRRIASAISSWRRGCRSSSGAASRTTSCSTSPARAGCAIRRCSSSRSSACSPIRSRRR